MRRFSSTNRQRTLTYIKAQAWLIGLQREATQFRQFHQHHNNKHQRDSITDGAPNDYPTKIERGREWGSPNNDRDTSRKERYVHAHGQHKNKTTNTNTNTNNNAYNTNYHGNANNKYSNNQTNASTSHHTYSINRSSHHRPRHGGFFQQEEGRVPFPSREDGDRRGGSSHKGHIAAGIIGQSPQQHNNGAHQIERGKSSAGGVTIREHIIVVNSSHRQSSMKNGSGVQREDRASSHIRSNDGRQEGTSIINNSEDVSSTRAEGGVQLPLYTRGVGLGGNARASNHEKHADVGTLEGPSPPPPLRIACTTLASLSDGLWHILSTSSHTRGKGRRAAKALGRSQSDLGAVRRMVDSLLEGYGLNNTANSGVGDGVGVEGAEDRRDGGRAVFFGDSVSRYSSTSTMKEKEESLAHMISVLVSAWSEEMGLLPTKNGHSTSITSSGNNKNGSGYRGGGLRTTTSTLFDVVRMIRCLVSILTVSNDAIRGPIDRWSPRQVEGAAACFAATSIILLRYHSHLNHHNNNNNLDVPSPLNGCASSSTPFVRGGPLCSTILGMRALHQRLGVVAAPCAVTAAAATNDEGLVESKEVWHFLKAANETAAADPRRALCEEYLTQPWFVSLVARSSLASRSSSSSLHNSHEGGQAARFVSKDSDVLMWRMSDRAEELLLSAIKHAYAHDFGDDKEKEKEKIYSSTPPHAVPRTSSTLRSGQQGHSKGRLSYPPYANIAQLVLGILAVEWEQRLLLQHVSLRCAVSIPSSTSINSPQNEGEPDYSPSTGHNKGTPNPSLLQIASKRTALKAPMYRLPSHLKPDHTLIIGDAPAQIGIKALEALLHIAVGADNDDHNASERGSVPSANQLFVEQITQTLAVAFHAALDVFESAAKAPPTAEVPFGGCDYQGDSSQRSSDVGRDTTRATRKGFRPPRHNNSKYDKICDEAFSSLERLNTMIREWGITTDAPAGLCGRRRGTWNWADDERDATVGFGSPSVFRRGRTSARGGHALSAVSQSPATSCGTRWVGDKDFVQRLFVFPEKSLRRLPFNAVLSSERHSQTTAMKKTDGNSSNGADGDTYGEEGPSNETNTSAGTVFILAPTVFRFERIEEALFCLVLPLVEICSNILLTVPFPLPSTVSSALANSDVATQSSKLPSQSSSEFTTRTRGAFVPYFPRCPYGHTMEEWIMLICNVVTHYCVFPCPRGVLAVLEWLLRLCEHFDGTESNTALLPSLGKDEGTRRPAVDGGKGRDHHRHYNSNGMDMDNYHMPLRTLFCCLTHDLAITPKEAEGVGREESRAASGGVGIDLTRVARAVLLASSSAGAEWDASLPCTSDSGVDDSGNSTGNEHRPLLRNDEARGNPAGAAKGGISSSGSGLNVIRGLGLAAAAADGESSSQQNNFARPSLYTCPTLLGGDTLSALYKHAHACDIARSSDTMYFATYNEEEKRTSAEGSLKNSCDLEDSECMIHEEESDCTDAELLLSVQNSLDKRGPRGSFPAREHLQHANRVNGRGERPYNHLRCIAYLPQPCLALALYLARAAAAHDSSRATVDGFVIKQHDCGGGAGGSLPSSVGGGVHHKDDDAVVGVAVDVSTILFCLKESLSIVDGVGPSSPLASAELPAGLLESVLSIPHDGLGSAAASVDMDQHNKSPLSQAKHPNAKSTASVSVTPVSSSSAPSPPLAAHRLGQFDSYDAFGLAMSLIRLNEVYEHGRLNKWMMCNDSLPPTRGESIDRDLPLSLERKESEQTLLLSSQIDPSRGTAFFSPPWSRAGEAAAVRMAHYSLFALLMPFIIHSEVNHNSRIVKGNAERVAEAHVSSPFLWRVTMEGLVKSYRSWGPAPLLSTNKGRSASTTSSATVGTLMRFILVITGRMHTVLAQSNESTRGGTSRAGKRAMEAPEGYVCALLQFEKLCRDIANGRRHSKHTSTLRRAAAIHHSTSYCYDNHNDDYAGEGSNYSIEIDLVEREILSAYGRLVLGKRAGMGPVCDTGIADWQQEPIGRDTSASIDALAGSHVPLSTTMVVLSHTKYDVLNTFRVACNQLSPEAITSTTNRLSFSVAEAAAIPFEGGAFGEDEDTEKKEWGARNRTLEYNTFARIYTEVCSNRLGW